MLLIIYQCLRAAVGRTILGYQVAAFTVPIDNAAIQKSGIENDGFATNTWIYRVAKCNREEAVTAYSYTINIFTLDSTRNTGRSIIARPRGLTDTILADRAFRR